MGARTNWVLGPEPIILAILLGLLISSKVMGRLSGGSHFSEENRSIGKLEVTESAFFTTEEGNGLPLFGTIHSKG